MIDIFLSLLETEEERSRFLSLYDNHKDRMYRVAMRYLHNSSDAEDAVHEAFLQIADDRAKVFDVAPNKRAAFLNILIRNISVKMFNKSNEVVITDPHEFYEKVGYKEISLEDSIVSKISRQELVDYILSLPEGMRDAMYLKYVVELPNSIIAQRLGITENALRQRLFSGRKAIREFIDKGEHHERRTSEACASSCM